MATKPHELLIDRPGPNGRQAFTVSREDVEGLYLVIDGAEADRYHPLPGEEQSAANDQLPGGAVHWQTAAGVYALTKEEDERARSLPLQLTGVTPPPLGRKLIDEISNNFVLDDLGAVAESGCPGLTALDAWRRVRDALAPYTASPRLRGITTGLLGSVDENGRSDEWEFMLDLVEEIAQLWCHVRVVTARDVYGETAVGHGASPDDRVVYVTVHVKPWPLTERQWGTRRELPVDGWRDSAAACADFVAQGADWHSVSAHQDQIGIAVFADYGRPVWEMQLLEIPVNDEGVEDDGGDEDDEGGFREKLYESPFLSPTG